MSPTRRRYGSGSLTYDEARGLWVASLELPSHGKRRRKVIRRKNKGDAVAALREMKRELERTGDLATSSPTVAQWCDLWLERIARPRLKPSSYADYASTVEQYVKPSVGRVRLDKLTTGHVRQMHADITGRGLSTTTALKAHRVLAKMLKDAEREGRIGRNVATLVDAPRKAVPNRGALTVAEAQAVLRSSADDPLLAVAWSLALLTGLRRGEIAGLTADMIDLDRGTLTVAWQLQRLRWRHGCSPACGRTPQSCPQRTAAVPSDQEARAVSGGLWLLRPKSRAGWRQVPLAPLLVDVLRGWLDTYGTGPQGLVLHRGDRAVDPNELTIAWGETCKAAGVSAVPLHSARHTCATLLYELGVPEDTRVAILGHSSATVTQGYTHVSDPLKVDAMRRLGELVGGNG